MFIAHAHCYSSNSVFESKSGGKVAKSCFWVTVTLYRLMVLKKPFVYHVFMRVLCIIVTLWLYEYPVET